MAFGTLMNNSAGIKILSEDFDTLCLSNEVYNSVKAGGSGTTGVYRLRNKPGCITSVQITPNIYEIYIYGNDLAVSASKQWSTPASIGVTYYSGTAPSSLPLRYVGPSRFIGNKTGTHGMQLFNSSGQLTLDARDNVLNCSKVKLLNQNIPQSGVGTSVGTVNYSITNNSWFAICAWRQWFESALAGGYGVDYGLRRVSEGSNNWRALATVLEEPGVNITSGGNFGYYVEFTI